MIGFIEKMIGFISTPLITIPLKAGFISMLILYSSECVAVRDEGWLHRECAKISHAGGALFNYSSAESALSRRTRCAEDRDSNQHLTESEHSNALPNAFLSHLSLPDLHRNDLKILSERKRYKSCTISLITFPGAGSTHFRESFQSYFEKNETIYVPAYDAKAWPVRALQSPSVAAWPPFGTSLSSYKLIYGEGAWSACDRVAGDCCYIALVTNPLTHLLQDYYKRCLTDWNEEQEPLCNITLMEWAQTRSGLLAKRLLREDCAARTYHCSKAASHGVAFENRHLLLSDLQGWHYQKAARILRDKFALICVLEDISDCAQMVRTAFDLEKFRLQHIKPYPRGISTLPANSFYAESIMRIMERDMGLWAIALDIFKMQRRVLRDKLFEQ